MVIAVLQRWGGVALGGKDVLAATVGGARMTEPAADLPLALAIWSSVRDIPLAPGLVVIGELGLAADVRPVGGVAAPAGRGRAAGFRPCGGARRGSAPTGPRACGSTRRPTWVMPSGPWATMMASSSGSGAEQRLELAD